MLHVKDREIRTSQPSARSTHTRQEPSDDANKVHVLEKFKKSEKEHKIPKNNDQSEATWVISNYHGSNTRTRVEDVEEIRWQGEGVLMKSTFED